MNQVSKFIILTHQRSGSTFFCETLNKHPDIFCGDELYLDNDKNKQVLSKLEMDTFRNSNMDVLDYSDWYTMKSLSMGKSSTGFKLVPTNIPPAVTEPILTHGFKVIMLSRKNLLKSALSFCLSLKTAQWFDEDKKDFEPLELDIEFIFKAMMIFSIALDFWRNILKKNGIDYLELTYENLFSKETMDSVYDHIGVDKLDTFEYEKKVMTDNNRMKKILNLEDIEKELGSDFYGHVI